MEDKYFSTSNLALSGRKKSSSDGFCAAAAAASL